MAAPDRLYVVAAWVPRRATITVGALGPVRIERGWQAYVGSARRGRDARVARHCRAVKPLRWHADYLFAPWPATRAWLLDTALDECALAARLRAALAVPCAARGAGTSARPGAGAGPAAAGSSPRLPAAGFGSSDCGCPGHLVRAPSLAALRGALRAAVGEGDTLRATRAARPGRGS
jgi:Uri superfamily endonuclease